VRAGQTLIVLDDRELAAGHARAAASLVAARRTTDAVAAERAAAEADLDLAKATHRRIADLEARSSATPQELDQAVAALRGAEARVRAAEARRGEAEAQVTAAQAAADGSAVAASYAVLKSPFDGVVTRKLVEAGNTATPGTPLLTIDDTRAFRLEVQVDESRASLVSVGEAVPVFLDATDSLGASMATGVAGRVSEIERAADAGAHTFLVKIDLPSAASLRSGLYGRARFAGATRRTLVVPSSSMVRQGQLTYVFVAERDGRAHLRVVRPGASADSMVEVVAGLSEGERIVVSPGPMLADGSRVSARRER
jgi:RND family efflux transporter MFP subunit